MPEGSVTTSTLLGPEIYITTEDIRPVVRTKENEGANRRIIRHHIALGASVVQDGPSLKSREISGLHETPENKEAKMIKCLEIMLDA